MSTKKSNQYGFADTQMLEKIDKLFACGVGELVYLPQIVVVGDQSSGKSSVLEGLIKQPLPRDSGLCTRFATHIVFRRASNENIFVSIIPSRDAPEEHSTRVRAWGRAVTSLDSDTFKEIMQEAHQQMGLSGEEVPGEKKPTFSGDVLRLEISGPDQEHLSVIDVPGIFKTTTKGVTTKADIQLVRNMVKEYMDNPRTVMLTVVPANVDVATQEILELALEADPSGDRTLGVLTKPDLVDKGAEPGVVAIVEGRVRATKLGWHIIRNPGQKELQESTLDRSELETNFFRVETPWNSVDKEKVGVDRLKLRIKEVLASLVKREFPKVKAEIPSRLSDRRRQLEGLGPERNTSADQMAYLTKIASKFQRLVSLALNATHGADDAFESDFRLRIAPALVSRTKAFSDEMAKYGHTYSFATSASNNSNSIPEGFSHEFGADSVLSKQEFEVRRQEDHEDLVDILHPQVMLSYPRGEEIKAWLLQVYQSNRGFELGTFNASILATTMKKQSSKWTEISMGFVSDVIVMVHNFVGSALAIVCPDRNVREALMSKLSDGLIGRYQKALDSTRFLLDVENSDMPLTLNHYFNDNLQKSRQNTANARIMENAIDDCSHGYVVQVEQLTQSTKSMSMSNEEHVVQDIHDILQSYYKVTRKTFVDCVSKHSAVHYLLQCENSPLALFSPTFVSGLSAEELEEIAGEAPALQRSRAQLTKENASLSEAVRVLMRSKKHGPILHMEFRSH